MHYICTVINVVNPLSFNDDSIVVLPFTIKDDDNNVSLLTNKSFRFENPLIFKFEYIVILSDVILVASMSFNPVDDKPQQSI